MANKDYTQPTLEQMKIAFSEIAEMAGALRHLCNVIITDNSGGNNAVAASIIAGQIGWIADRCICFDQNTPESWLLPPSWDFVEKDSHH